MFYDGFFDSEIFGIVLMWVGFMAVFVYFVGHIALLVHRQILAERAYRVHLAMWRAAESREARAAD